MPASPLLSRKQDALDGCLAATAQTLSASDEDLRIALLCVLQEHGVTRDELTAYREAPNLPGRMSRIIDEVIDDLDASTQRN